MKAYEAAATSNEDRAKRLRGSHSENLVREMMNIVLIRAYNRQL
jgi:hypothetical protein